MVIWIFVLEEEEILDQPLCLGRALAWLGLVEDSLTVFGMAEVIDSLSSGL